MPEASRHGDAGSPALRVCLSQIPNPQSRPSLHEPAMADHQALPGQRVGLEGGERERDVGDVVDGGELAIDGVLEHHVLHHLVLADAQRSEEHTSELQSLMRTSYAVFCLKKKKHKKLHNDI